MNTVVGAADKDAAVASPATIQLMVAKLRFTAEKPPVIGACKIMVDKDIFSNRFFVVVLPQL